MISHRATSLRRCASALRQNLSAVRALSSGVAFQPMSSSNKTLSAPSRLSVLRLDQHHYRQLHTSFLLREIIEVEGPEFAESISEGDIHWLKQKGEFVNADDLVAEIETDKTSVEVPAPTSGTLVELLVEDGGRVTAKQKLYKLEPGEGSGEAAAPPAEAPKEEEAAAAAPPPPPPAAAAPPPPPPAAAAAPPPPPPAAAAAPPAAAPPAGPAASVPVGQVRSMPIPPGVAPDQAITGSRDETRVKMNRMRQRIAARLKEAQNTYAMLTTFNEIDMSNVMEMRKQYQKAFVAKHGIKLGLMSPFVKASAYALTQQPTVNAVIDENEMVYRHYVDMSIAVATPKGLVVPVLRNCEQMDFAEIERTLADVGNKARDGKLAIEDMQGGTFTISNGGVFGSLMGTPIINPPQSAILGMHGIFDKPVAVKGEVKIRPVMVVALTYDHRMVDGREAVTFLKKIKEAVEDPRIMLMNL